MPKYKDIVGQKFGRLTVISRAKNDSHGNARWNCLCDCGKAAIVRGGLLRRGKTLSCGCLLSEKSHDRMTKLATKHGKSKSPLYRVYYSMLRRCNSPKEKEFKDYGGRGITVCKQWEHDFMSFYSWAISHGYKHGLEIDRINNDGPYSPQNCRWVTSLVNCHNSRRVVPVVLYDSLLNEVLHFPSINYASKKTGISASTIYRMIHKTKTREERFSIFHEL